MPVPVIFRCDVCGAQPDEAMRRTLERQRLGTLGCGPWKMGPHPWGGRRGTDGPGR